MEGLFDKPGGACSTNRRDDDTGFNMTPERRQQLMEQAAKEMRSRWGEVQPDALQALADDLRTGVIENGALSVGDIVSEVMHGAHSQGLFGPTGPSGQMAISSDRIADKQRDTDLER